MICKNIFYNPIAKRCGCAKRVLGVKCKDESEDDIFIETGYADDTFSGRNRGSGTEDL